LIYDPAVSTTTYRRVSEKTGYVATVPDADICISAFGRLWVANTTTNNSTVYFSDLIAGHVWATGTAGSLGSIRRNILQNNGHILVINADVISNLNYLSAIKFHQKCQSDFTIVSKEVTTTIPYGVLKIEDDKVTRIIEKPNFNNFINIGIYVINGEVLDLIPVNSGFNMDSLINKAVSKSYTVKLFDYSGEWVDVGHPSEYIEVQNKFDTFKIF
jgi:NDP-sugar pyrophosphorylase family protein